MSTAAVLQPIDLNIPFNRTVVISKSRLVPQSTTLSSDWPTSSGSCAKSQRRRLGRSVDTKRREENERKTKELVMENVTILKRGEIVCPNLVKCFADVNKKNGVALYDFSGNGFMTAPPASDLPMPNKNWLRSREENVNIDDVDFLP